MFKPRCVWKHVWLCTFGSISIEHKIGIKHFINNALWKFRSILGHAMLIGSEDQSIFQLLPSGTTRHQTIRGRRGGGGERNGFAHCEKPKNRKRDGVWNMSLDAQQALARPDTQRLLQRQR